MLFGASEAPADPFACSWITYESTTTIGTGADALKFAWPSTFVAGNRWSDDAIIGLVFIERDRILGIPVAHALTGREIPGCRLNPVTFQGSRGLSRAPLDAAAVHNGVIIRNVL